MKVAWFTPFSPRSAIGQCSRLVVDELRRHCDVDIWTPEGGVRLDANVTVIPFGQHSDWRDRLAAYDHCVFNMGNHYPFHAGIFEVMQNRPGVVVLHDVLMHHFFMDCFLHHKRSPQLYVAEMARSYGAAGRAVAERSVEGRDAPVWLTDEVSRFPLFERLVDGALGVFVHSRYHRDIVLREYVGEVGCAYLPYQRAERTRPRAKLLREFGIEETSVVALSTGIVHPVKQLELVIAALAAVEHRSNLIYVVIGEGSADYLARLRAMAAELGVGQAIRFLGYQPADVMHDFLDAADFAINLRYPNSEGCSLSLVEQMSFGKPVIALDTGMYREVPDDAVLKVEHPALAADLARHIERLMSDPALRSRMGTRAGEFAHSNFTAREYSRRLLAFLASIGSTTYQPVHAILRRIAGELGRAGYAAERDCAMVEPLLQDLHILLTDSSTTRADSEVRLGTLGVWLAFEHPTPLHREGMTRFLLYLLRQLIADYQVDVEIWCYSHNEASVIESFGSLLSDRRYATHVRILHERNCSVALGSSASAIASLPPVSVDSNNLFQLANAASRADCFLLGICYLDNALPLTKPVFVPLHDLIVLEHYESFVGKNPPFRPYARKIREAVEQFARRDAFFFCNSEHVRKNQLMKYIERVDAASTAVVYLPTNVPAGIHDRIPAEAAIRGRFALTKPYFFYPTQIRHHKNVITLLRAFGQLVADGAVADLVLTGTPDHVPAVAEYIVRNRLTDRVVLVRDVSEEALYALHAYAAATVVPTLFEGGFPWQALEAMLMNTPVILSRIEAVSERLSAFGIDVGGLHLFEPQDHDTLAAYMSEVLRDRTAFVTRQQTVKQALFAYGWQDVARSYFEVMSRRIQNPGSPLREGQQPQRA
jgi:glycosyltransferase involved in cell wall biosynthesis